ncbi:MAG: hypothetical protein DCC44_01135 [Acidobacteria bacterium]|nr:hypothetical protein [Pyrinomonadaceae bacterium]RIJ96350.1 MAG: hypothetical protein DCC44_01135 [Acidobacteriota bacterium]
MYLQHDDPHRHTAPGIETFYLFLILAPILVALLVFLLWKVLNHLENEKPPIPQKNRTNPDGANEKHVRNA